MDQIDTKMETLIVTHT